MTRLEFLKNIEQEYPGLEFGIKEKNGFFYPAINGMNFSPGYDKEDVWHQECDAKSFVLIKQLALSFIKSKRFQDTLEDTSLYKIKKYTIEENGIEYDVLEDEERRRYFFKDTENLGRFLGACVETLDGDENKYLYKVGQNFLKQEEYWNHPDIKKELAKKRL